MRQATEERASNTCQENTESKPLYCNVQGTVCISPPSVLSPNTAKQTTISTSVGEIFLQYEESHIGWNISAPKIRFMGIFKVFV